MSERLNIKHFSAEPEKEPERPFDPERDLTQKDWKLIITQGERQRVLERWDGYASYAVFQHLLKRKIDLSDDELESLEKGIDHARLNGDWGSLAKMASLKLIQGREPDLRSSEVDAVTSARNSSQNWYSFSSYAVLELLLGRKIDLLPEKREVLAQWCEDDRKRHHWETLVQLGALELLLQRQDKDSNKKSFSPDIDPLPETRNF